MKAYTHDYIITKALDLEQRLLQIPFEKLPLSEDVKSYFRFNIPKLRYVSLCNAYILFHILENKSSEDPYGYIVDHGAGIGFFSFLITFMGLPSIYHDLSNDYAQGAKIIGDYLELTPDVFIVGDTDELVRKCKEHSFIISGLGSRNVIEHIPDYSSFFKEISSLSSTSFTCIITTSANIHNPVVHGYHKKIHRQYELMGPKENMHTSTTLFEKSGIEIRKKLIKSHFPTFTERELRELSKLNRGFLTEDILDRCRVYQQTGQLPKPFPEPTNTRDIENGTWIERLVSSSDYRLAAEKAGFTLEVLPGFYNTNYTKFYLNVLAGFMNLLIKIMPNASSTLSPFLSMKLIKKHNPAA